MTYEQSTLLLYNALHGQHRQRQRLRRSSLGFTVSNGQVDTSSVLLKQPQGSLCSRRGHPAALYAGERLPQR
ncbi:MAG: hypothetical protein ACLT9S_15865 [Faecalibacterium sp.]